MRIAVVGSGAAALGVFEALHRKGGGQVILFDHGSAPSDLLRPKGGPEGWRKSEIARIYKAVKEDNGGVPLPKSHFGEAPDRLKVDGKSRVWISRHTGGLTNFWGGTMLPFRQEDLKGWPFTAAELEPYYVHIARRVGVSGASDGLNGLYGEAFVTRPPIKSHPGIQRLTDALMGQAAGGIDFTAGLNRTALETRPEAKTSCISCGECMIGCFRRSTFSSTDLLSTPRLQAIVSSRVRARVVSIDPDAGTLTCEGGGKTVQHGPFDRIYLAAGCLGSTEIVMRSVGGGSTARMGDSFSINMPIVNLSGEGMSDYGRHFGLANALMVAVDAVTGETAAQGQIYPTVDHFWRSAVPPALWGAAALSAVPLKHRLMWLRMYLPPDQANHYRLSLDGQGNLQASLEAPEGAMEVAGRVVSALEEALKGKGFWLARPLIAAGGSSSHYAASLADRARFGIDADCRWGGRVVICDSSTWPETPVQSPTFTIMANAMRLAELSL